MMNLVVGCSELVQSAVSPGSSTEGLLKVRISSSIHTACRVLEPSSSNVLEKEGTQFHLSSKVLEPSSIYLGERGNPVPFI